MADIKSEAKIYYLLYKNGKRIYLLEDKSFKIDVKPMKFKFKPQFLPVTKPCLIVKSVPDKAQVIEIPIDTSHPNTIDLWFRDVKTGKGFAISMSAEALMNIMIKHWDCDITRKMKSDKEPGTHL